MKNVLEIVEKNVAAKVESGFDAKVFFENRKGLYIWSGFKDNIVEKSMPVTEDKKFEVTYAILTENASDASIETSMAGEHLFNENDVASIIADLIKEQEKGEEGILLNNGYANIFYTPSVVVFVRWRRFDSRWNVYADARVGSWNAGIHVFSPAIVS